MILRTVTYLATALLGVLLSLAPAQADRLVIPNLGVNAQIQEVGTRDGAQDAPPSLWTAYHWRQGVRPCEPGSTVLSGHNYEVPGGRALFRHLNTLRPGSVVKIVRPGQDCRYISAKASKVRFNANIAFMYDWDGPARGYLTTCIGRTGPGTYTYRLLVPMRLR